ncbi:MAG: RDD family protein, partial [Lentimicrobium sp.]|nr:RDD family protein [Lentimicrobium sp.]
MPEFDIYTSQNVNLNYKLAGIGKRISAFALDAIILIAYSVVMIVVLTAIGFQEWPVFFVASIPVLLYDLVMEIFFNGQTIGKSASNIRVVKVNGLQPSVTDYL